MGPIYACWCGCRSAAEARAGWWPGEEHPVEKREVAGLRSLDGLFVLSLKFHLDE